MPPKVQNDIELLTPAFKGRLLKFLDHMNMVDPMRCHETLRTKELQEYYYKTGKSKTLESNHLSGNAADIHFVKAPNWPPDNDARWIRAAQIAKLYGINNGGVMWGFDWNHFELGGNEFTLDNILLNNKIVWRLANDCLIDIKNNSLESVGEKLDRIREIVHSSNNSLREFGIKDGKEVELAADNLKNHGNDNTSVR